MKRIIGGLFLLLVISLLLVGVDRNSKARRVATAKQLGISVETYEALLYKYNSAGISDAAIDAALLAVKAQMDEQKAIRQQREPPHWGRALPSTFTRPTP